MLQLRPNCECCGKDLPPDSHNALICSFECTFCIDCVIRKLGGCCPNCGGDLVKRPPRSLELLKKYPPSIERIVKSNGCRPRTRRARSLAV
ncbi:MAG: DUF1272 domain-containing protein [Acidobacteria bacterium]|nr:DUF1272 domain-containing protein [Acidobacteriota bacterium]